MSFAPTNIMCFDVAVPEPTIVFRQLDGSLTA